MSLLFPHVCELCGTRPASPAAGLVCRECRDAPGHLTFVGDRCCDRCGLPFSGSFTSGFVCSNCHGVALGFRQARAAVVATPFILDLVHRYKYGRALWFEPFLAGLLREAAAPRLAAAAWDLIVPVPLHALREREREFNQAARLARQLGRATGIPVRHGLLWRSRATRTQALLDRAGRAKNVAGVFTARPSRELAGARCILVDDVLTTGATTSAAGRALRDAGARDVIVWTVARGA